VAKFSRFGRIPEDSPHFGKGKAAPERGSSEDDSRHASQARFHEDRAEKHYKAGEKRAGDAHTDAAAAHRQAMHAEYNKNDSDQDEAHYHHLASEARLQTRMAQAASAVAGGSTHASRMAALDAQRAGAPSPTATLKAGSTGQVKTHLELSNEHARREQAVRPHEEHAVTPEERAHGNRLADAHREAADAHHAAHYLQMTGDKDRYAAAKAKAEQASQKAAALETGPRGGTFTRTAGGGKRYTKRGGGGAVASMRSKIPEDTE
jgi:hypothetical protein